MVGIGLRKLFKEILGRNGNSMLRMLDSMLPFSP
jgi:hypothetical protein